MHLHSFLVVAGILFLVDANISSVSQCQAIHSRSILPVQDTPDVKSPVYYTLRSPLFVVAGGNPQNPEAWASTGSTEGYKYEQTIPIPSYLIAFASGDLKAKPIGPRSQVISGPEEVDGCQWELEKDMEKFLESAESLVFKYQWGTYNVLVLPNSFPYGGMENPTCNLPLLIVLYSSFQWCCCVVKMGSILLTRYAHRHICDPYNHQQGPTEH
jgi:aminopeptidase N